MADPVDPRRRRHKKIHDMHHSRNCTEPASPAPWIMALSVLPVSVFLLVNVASFGAGLLGLHNMSGLPGYIARDIWLYMTSDCPVTVTSQLRSMFDVAVPAQQEEFSSLNQMYQISIATHLNVLQDQAGISNLEWSNDSCLFHDMVLNKSSDLRHTSISGVLDQFNNNPCMSGSIQCRSAMRLNTPLLTNDGNAITDVRSIVILGENTDSAHAHTFSEAEDTFIYIQMEKSVEMLCVSADSGEQMRLHTLQPGSGVSIVPESCRSLLVRKDRGLAVGLLVNG